MRDGVCRPRTGRTNLVEEPRNPTGFFRSRSIGAVPRKSLASDLKSHLFHELESGWVQMNCICTKVCQLAGRSLAIH